MEYDTHFDKNFDLTKVKIKLFYSESSTSDVMKQWGTPIAIDTGSQLSDALVNIEGSETIKLNIPIELESSSAATISSELDIKPLKAKFVNEAGKVFYAQIEHVPLFGDEAAVDRYMLKNIKFDPILTPNGKVTTDYPYRGQSGIIVVFVNATQIENSVNMGKTSLLLRYGAHANEENYFFYTLDQGIFDGQVRADELNSVELSDIKKMTFSYYGVSEEEFADPTDWSTDNPNETSVVDLDDGSNETSVVDLDDGSNKYSQLYTTYFPIEDKPSRPCFRADSSSHASVKKQLTGISSNVECGDICNDLAGCRGFDYSAVADKCQIWGGIGTKDFLKPTKSGNPNGWTCNIRKEVTPTIRP
jgi:hypothetical protein